MANIRPPRAKRGLAPEKGVCTYSCLGWSFSQAYALVLWPRFVALPKHSLRTITGVNAAHRWREPDSAFGLSYKGSTGPRGNRTPGGARHRYDLGFDRILGSTPPWAHGHGRFTERSSTITKLLDVITKLLDVNRKRAL